MYDYFIWRRTEEAITGLTRNQFIGAILIRGFESLRLRCILNRPISFFTMLFHSHTAAHTILSAVLCDNQLPFYLVF